MSPRPKRFASFSIFDSCRQGLLMVVHSRSVLMRMGLPAMMAALATGFVTSQMPGLSPLRLFFVSLPGFAISAWFLGNACRHWLLGETPDAPADPRAERRAMLQATVLTYILWKALVAAYEQLLVYFINPEEMLKNPQTLQNDPQSQLFMMILMGILFWALRFRLLPVLAAIGQPIKDYIARAQGFMLSLRLLGVVLVCVEMPRALVIATLVSATGSSVVVHTAQSALTLVLETWLFAAFIAAMRQMTGKQQA